MRRLVVLAVALLAALPTARAEDSEGLVAAVAPAQTVVDAGARMIGLALAESYRDGTPDAAFAILEDIRAFVAALDAEWRLTESATYPIEAAAALRYAVGIEKALRDLPSAAADVAVVAFACGTVVKTAAERDALFLGIARLEGIQADLVRTATLAPEGVDASRLEAEAMKISGWVEGYEIGPRCEFGEDPFLRLEAVPSTSWPGGEIRLVGATNAGASVTLRSAEIGLDQRVRVAAGRFGAAWKIPESTPLGNVTLHANTSLLSSTADLSIAKVPTSLYVRSDMRFAPGAEFFADVRLLSPRPALVSNAMIETAGYEERRFGLENASARILFQAPEIPGQYDLTFTFAGSDLLSASSETLIFRVAAPPTPATDREAALRAGGAAGAGGPLPIGGAWAPLLLLLLAIGALVLGATVAFDRRRRHQLAPVPKAEALVSLRKDPELAFSRIPEIFAAIILWLRKAGRLPASTTAREAAAKLRAWGADPGVVVFAFERTRYGEETPTPVAVERVRVWARSTWARLRGVET